MTELLYVDGAVTWVFWLCISIGVLSFAFISVFGGIVDDKMLDTLFVSCLMGLVGFIVATLVVFAYANPQISVPILFLLMVWVGCTQLGKYLNKRGW